MTVSGLALILCAAVSFAVGLFCLMLHLPAQDRPTPYLALALVFTAWLFMLAGALTLCEGLERLGVIDPPARSARP